MMSDVFFAINGNVYATGAVRRAANGQPQSLNASIPDGDTAGLHLEGSGSVRFLGIDTPEKNFQLPGAKAQRRLDSAEWDHYLTDPFLPQFGPYDLDPHLVDHLRTRIGPSAGTNHRFHGDNAEKALIALVQADMNALGQDLNTFAYFLSFSFEVFDPFGRFLAFINRNQPSASPAGPRPLSYNERMLESGAALPYFIWPNIDPFRGRSSLLDAVIAPGTANQVADATPALRRARDFVRQARTRGTGVFAPANPLRFEAFEVRYLGRRQVPNRAVIDLSRSSNIILQPQHYFRIPNAEDRLFIPSAFIPLFVSRGWRLEGWF
jgi:endonuclease YncB( thermonuclease family)